MGFLHKLDDFTTLKNSHFTAARQQNEVGTGEVFAKFLTKHLGGIAVK